MGFRTILMNNYSWKHEYIDRQRGDDNSRVGEKEIGKKRGRDIYRKRKGER